MIKFTVTIGEDGDEQEYTTDTEQSVRDIIGDIQRRVEEDASLGDFEDLKPGDRWWIPAIYVHVIEVS
jgi:hypothetical protein